jgi:phospholipid/cholesterol/gamma-HCH transport system substrate-binding protein
MCEGDENYAPLNDGYNWKGDPNATLSGQDVPQFAPGEAPPQAAQPRPVTPAQVGLPAVAYDPATGKYVGPDGRVYTQGDLAGMASSAKTWQQLLVPPPAGN